MNRVELEEILKKHSLWLSGMVGGKRAVLKGCDLRGCDLRGRVLRSCDLRSCDLRGCDFRGCNLRGCIYDSSTLWPEFQLPSGRMVGYKKVHGGVILTLEISEERTACLISNKCRCRSVKVLGADVKGTEFQSLYNPDFTYRVGETVTVEDWSDDIRIECAPGIHFFRTFEEALSYWL